MPKGKGYKAAMSRKPAKSKPTARAYTIPSGKVSGKASKKKFNAGAYAKMHTKVFGLAKKEQMGKI